MPITLVGSANGAVGMDAGWVVLAAGGPAIDAVEAACRVVEDNPGDHTVGYGGYPNLEGMVELDASIMDGTTRAAGAVGALRGHRAAITVARAVMDRLPHVLVVGEGASRLAAEIGLVPEEMLTPEAEAVWRDGLAGRLAGDSLGGRMFALVRELASDPDRARQINSSMGDTDAAPPDASTVNFIAIDAAGHMASAVSTSGWAWKYPGRLGDTPVIGAGNYCDSRFGAATCTGYGELAIRTSMARTVVASMETGTPPLAALASAAQDLRTLGVPDERVILHALAVTPSGEHAAVTTRAAGAEYVVWAEGMASFARLPRSVV